MTLGLWLLVLPLEWLLGMYSTLRPSVDVTGTVTVEGRPPLMKLVEKLTADQRPNQLSAQ